MIPGPRLTLALLLPALAAAAPKAAPAARLGGLLRFGEDAVVAAGDVVEGPVLAWRGSVTVAGKVEGPVVALGGSIRLEPGSSVEGPAVAVGGTASAEAGSTLDGPLVELPGAVPWRRLAVGLAALAGMAGSLWLVYKIVGAIGWIALAVLACLLAPKALDNSRAALERRPGRAAAAGLLFWPAVAVLGLTLLMSVIGIPALPLLALGAACAWGWGFAVVSAWAGRALTRGITENAALAVLAGAILLRVLHLLPVVGFAACAAVGVLGVGAAVVSRFGCRAPGEPAST